MHNAPEEELPARVQRVHARAGGGASGVCLAGNNGHHVPQGHAALLLEQLAETGGPRVQAAAEEEDAEEEAASGCEGGGSRLSDRPPVSARAGDRIGGASGAIVAIPAGESGDAITIAASQQHQPSRLRGLLGRGGLGTQIGS